VVQAKQGWSIHGAILGQLGEMPLYNAINFNWGIADNTTFGSYLSNHTVYNAQVKTFLCPSDPNAFTQLNSSYSAANNCYYSSLGTTTDILTNLSSSAPSFASVKTTGVFGFQQSKNISSIIDGTSNTIAFSESTVGNSSTAARVKLMGLTSVSLPAASVL